MIDMFSTRIMLRAIEQMYRPKSFLRDFIFGPALPSDTDVIDVDIIKGKRRLAPFVSALSQGKLVERTGFVTNTIRAPYIKEKRPITAQDLLKRRPGETIYAGGSTPADRAAEILGNDLRELDDMITRREEWMAAQIMDTGKVICTGDQISLTVDYGMTATTHLVTLTGADLWSATTSDPIGDMEDWAAQIAKDSGLTADTVIMGGSAWNNFKKHADVKEVLDYQRVEELKLMNQNLPSGAVYRCTVNLNGQIVKVYTYSESYVDSTDTNQPMVPLKKVWMYASSARFAMHYGAIQDMEAMFSVPRFAKSWEEKDPSARILLMQSAPLPAMHQPDACVSAVVLG